MLGHHASVDILSIADEGIQLTTRRRLDMAAASHGPPNLAIRIHRHHIAEVPVPQVRNPEIPGQLKLNPLYPVFRDKGLPNPCSPSLYNHGPGVGHLDHHGRTRSVEFVRNNLSLAELEEDGVSPTPVMLSANCPHASAVSTSFGGREVGARPQFLVANAIFAMLCGTATVAALPRRRLTLVVEDAYIEDAKVDAAEVSCRWDDVCALMSSRSSGGTLGEGHFGQGVGVLVQMIRSVFPA
jgi:hypothetical protein